MSKSQIKTYDLENLQIISFEFILRLTYFILEELT